MALDYGNYTVSVLDDTDPALSYKGSWFTRGPRDQNEILFHDSAKVCNDSVNGCEVSYVFNGPRTLLMGEHDVGRFYCHLNDSSPWMWYDSSTPSGSGTIGLTLCGVTMNSSSAFSMTLGQTGPDNALSQAANGTGLLVDAFERFTGTASEDYGDVWAGDFALTAPPAAFAYTTSVSSSSFSYATPTSSIGAPSSTPTAGVGFREGSQVGVWMALVLVTVAWWNGR